MSLKEIFLNVSLRLRFQGAISRKHYCSKPSNILETAEEQPIFKEEEFDVVEKEDRRNKSRLTPGHRNILFGEKPYNEAIVWYHNTVKYKKKILGRYGVKALGTPAGCLWPTREEIKELKEYERVAFPLDIQERLQKIKEEKKKKEEALIARQEEITVKMAGMKQLLISVQEKIAKKQEAELEAKLRKERKLEKIRRELIATGNVSKNKLEKALIDVEKDEKKKKKEAKKAKMLQRQQKMVEELTKKHLDESQKTEPKEEDEDEPQSKTK
ncbi:hypothetical protein WH47_01605 [Habropoda laboriosa]|uniref:Large ribosomal subunit protein mL64 n=1 Tax=Habropoda laboriosa TaxID=597456 RepID=A0A0L7R0Q4_9HYME|nr:PREDICTED: growth arrest and DNA damage-inducible proteins-interacting protein 1 [Habropoda laboriosa]KOC64437.1 hypothetical protein WH47_01605 [Habropoda laboriosa]